MMMENKCIRKRQLNIWIVVVAFLLTIVGCSDEGEKTDAGGDMFQRLDAAQRLDTASDMPIVDSSTLDQSPTTFTVSGSYWNWTDNQPLVGAQICLYTGHTKTNSCTTVGPFGDYEITVPGQAEIGLSYDLAGYERAFLSLFLTASLQLGKLGIVSDAQAKSNYADANVAYPPTTKGNILVNCPSGGKLEITPQEGVGPVYFNKSSLLDPALTEIEGWGGMFFELEPGEYEVDCTHPTLTCEASTGWSSQTSGVRLPVIPGYYSSAVFKCN